MRPALFAALVFVAGGSACSGSKPAPQPPAPVEAAPSVAATPAPISDIDARRAALNALLAEHWESRLARSPEHASTLGDLRYNDRWTDYSEAAYAADNDRARQLLARFEAIDAAGLSEHDALNHRLIVRELRRQVDEQRFEGWLMPVNQISGLQLRLPQLVPQLRFQTVKDYEDYVARLQAIPAVLEQGTALARAGMAKGLMPPRYLLEKAADQTDKLAKNAPADSPFAIPVKTFPDGIAAADQERLRTAVLSAIETKVLPAYAAFAGFLAREYAPRGRSDVGVWSLPEGDARYAAAIRNFTTTAMSAAELHQLGVDEVARIEAEMAAIAKRLGLADTKALQAKIRKDKKLYAKSRQDIVDRYQVHTERMYQVLPRLFGRIPAQKMVILPVESFREKDASGASYQRGTPDGSRPGQVRVNTSDATRRSITKIESTAYHEGVPGHHMQNAIAQSLPDLPPFRQNAHFSAYGEGWALYSERLGKEVGFFEDPYSEYGHLEAELMRAIRLVVDTGLHSKKWTRDQVIAYFHAHSAIDEPTVQGETDRYIAWPGQALAYKVGQLTILRLRQKAQDTLGDRFDLRAFHDEVLGGGPLPLDVLEERVDAWIARRKTTSS